MKILVYVLIALTIGCSGSSGDTFNNISSGDLINVSGRYEFVEEDAPRQCAGTLIAVFGGTVDRGVEANLIIRQTGNQLQGTINNTAYVGILNDDLSFKIESSSQSESILFRSILEGQFSSFGRISGIKTDTQGENFVDTNSWDGLCGANAYFEGVRL
jgi:hypothetical protein